jgi:glutamate-ammonia-ligase adenylyltransferase
LKSEEELFEELGRFAAIQSHLSEAAILSRFKRREWLRIYLRDCLKLATLTETTLELSNLADILLQRALWYTSQQLVNQYGTPETKDERGRIVRAEFAIVALGKLGSQELNYASDIDLLYLYSQSGQTSTGQLSNKEFFIKLAERITTLVGGVGEDGAVYRIDVRLRPHGRVGDLAISLDEAVQYYQRIAQLWERQVLIRARVSAGDEALVQQFLTAVGDQIYPPEPLPELLGEIRVVKDKIDQEAGRSERGINVKLGKGGIREIEFIAQALQLYFGGQEPWVRTGQVLIGLQRLADKAIIADADRAKLSEAYTFLRTVEHRVQMEHGMRTHLVPADAERLIMLARRLGYVADDSPQETFMSELKRHMSYVDTTFEHLFRSSEEERARRLTPLRDEQDWKRAQLDAALNQLAAAFDASAESRTALPELVPATLAKTLNQDRAIKNLVAFAQSLAHAIAEDRAGVRPEDVSDQAFLETVERLIRFFGVSQFFSQVLISHPRLVNRLARTSDAFVMQTSQTYLERLRLAITDTTLDPSLCMDALRRQWHEELLHIGYLDITGVTTLRQTNSLQTALARASLRVACELARRQLEVKFGTALDDLRYVIFGLGRLGHNGVDYGSDLDLLVVYDEAPGSPVTQTSAGDFYSAFVAQVVHILSAITREGFLYSIDLRLRPDGKSSPLASSRSAFLEYVRHAAATWEHMAYLKAYPVVGELEFATAVQHELQSHLLQAHCSRAADLAREVRSMRQRLEREKARGTAQRHIKYGVGGMLDVYFATRFLQLKHQIPEPVERGTLPLINHLAECGVIDDAQRQILFDGYAFLRLTDHCLRLLYDRSKPIVPANQEQLRGLARLFGAESVESWQQEYQFHTTHIRQVYEQLVKEQTE